MTRKLISAMNNAAASVSKKRGGGQPTRAHGNSSRYRRGASPDPSWKNSLSETKFSTRKKNNNRSAVDKKIINI